MENQQLRKSPLSLGFSKLPPEKKETLVRMQKQPEENTFVFLRKFPVYYWIIAAVSLFWFIYLFVSTQNVRWEPMVYWLSAGLTLVASFGFVHSLIRIISSFFSDKSDGYVFTPDEFIKIEGNSVQIWNLKQLESLRVDEDQKQIETWIGEHEERLKYNDFAVAKKLEELFDGWKVNAVDNFAIGLDDAKFSYNSAGSIGMIFFVAVISVVVAFSVFNIARIANINYDDDVLWGLAEKVGTIEDLESYKSKHPEGRHLADANQQIRQILSKINEDYAAKPKDSANPIAVETLTSVLSEITKSTDRRIFVKIKETRELDDAVIKELESTFGFDVESYEYTAPVSGEEFRKEKVLSALKLTLRDIVKDGAIALVATDDVPELKPVIEVNYLIRSAKTYFAYNLFFQGRNSLKFYPGLEFNFDLKIKSGDAAKEFSNTYTILPTKIKPSIFREEDVSNYTFDKNLFTTASEDFSQQMGVNLGLGG